MPKPKPIPETLPPGVYRRHDGYRAVAKVGKRKRREKLFPLDTPMDTIVAWLEATRTEFRDESQPAAVAGSLLHELETTYIPTRTGEGMPTIKNMEFQLRRVFAQLGPTRKANSITPADLRAAIAVIGKRQKWCSSTFERIRGAVMGFYTTINGKRGYNPAKDIPKYPEHVNEEPTVPITLALIDRIIDAMPDLGAQINRGGRRKGQHRPCVSLTKIRLRVIQFTGLPHKQITLLKPQHLDFARSRVWVTGRNKGARTKSRWITMGEHGMTALRAFADAGAWGPFSASSMYKSFKLAAFKVAPDLAPQLSPYKLKHLYAAVATLASGDEGGVSGMIIHTRVETSRIYTEAVEGFKATREGRIAAAYDAEVTAQREAARRAAKAVTERSFSKKVAPKGVKVLAFGGGKTQNPAREAR